MGYQVSNLLSSNSELTAQSLPAISKENVLAIQSEQPVSEDIHSREDLSVFFGIGMTANIIMVIAFVIWGIKQWKKNDANKK